MSIRKNYLISIFIVVIILLGDSDASAAAIVKNDNTDALNQISSWVGGVVPGAGNIATWDATLTVNNTSALGTNQSWQGISHSAGKTISISATIFQNGSSVSVDSGNNLFTYTGTDVSNDNSVYFTATSLPAGLVANHPYYIVNSDNVAKTYQISNTPAGTAIDFTSNGSAVKNYVHATLYIGSSNIVCTFNQSFTIACALAVPQHLEAAFGPNNGSTISGPLLGSGTIDLRPSAMLAFTPSQCSLTGNITVHSGIFAIANSTHMGTGELILNGGSLAFRSDSNISLSNNVKVTSDSEIFNGTGAWGGQYDAAERSFSTLTIGNSTLTVSIPASDNNDSGNVIFSATTLTGNATFNVNTGASYTNKLQLGVIQDGGSCYSITKTGVGLLSFVGTNSFSGNTTISAGNSIIYSGGSLASRVITVNSGANLLLSHSDCLADSSSLYLNGTINLAVGVSETIEKLYLGGIESSCGSYGSSASSAYNKNDTYFSGNGVLLVHPHHGTLILIE